MPAATLQPLAGFSVEARVLSRENYRLGREAELSPTDLALGWQRMREDPVLAQLKISQSSRWYHSVSYTHLDVYKRQGQSIDWSAPDGRKLRLRVTSIHYQPEANGNLNR